MFVSVDLPIPGEPPEQHERTGNEPAAEDPVELADAGRHTADGRRADLSQGQRAPLSRPGVAGGCAQPARPARPLCARVGSGSSTSVFHASQPGH